MRKTLKEIDHMIKQAEKNKEKDITNERLCFLQGWVGSLKLLKSIMKERSWTITD